MKYQLFSKYQIPLLKKIFIIAVAIFMLCLNTAALSNNHHLMLIMVGCGILSLLVALITTFWYLLFNDSPSSDK